MSGDLVLNRNSGPRRGVTTPGRRSLPLTQPSYLSTPYHSLSPNCRTGNKAMRSVAIICMCLISLSSFARLVPVKDPADGVLDAELVVIVQSSPAGPPGTFL